MSKYWATQSHFDVLHLMLTQGRLSRTAYIQEIDACESAIHPKFKPGLQKRIDKMGKRTLGQFALFIHDNTLRERFLAEAWMKMTKKAGILVNHGVGNDGRLILARRQDCGNADFLIVCPDEEDEKMEVKFNPVNYKNTFKLGDINAYLEAGAKVLLIMGNTKMIGPNGNPLSSTELKIPRGLKWSVFGTPEIQRMLEDFPVLPYEEMGGKLGIQLFGEKVIKKYLDVKDWV